jgi:hypothetical protein
MRNLHRSHAKIRITCGHTRTKECETFPNRRFDPRSVRFVGFSCTIIATVGLTVITGKRIDRRDEQTLVSRRTETRVEFVPRSRRMEHGDQLDDPACAPREIRMWIGIRWCLRRIEKEKHIEVRAIANFTTSQRTDGKHAQTLNRLILRRTERMTRGCFERRIGQFGEQVAYFAWTHFAREISQAYVDENTSFGSSQCAHELFVGILVMRRLALRFRQLDVNRTRRRHAAGEPNAIAKVGITHERFAKKRTAPNGLEKAAHGAWFVSDKPQIDARMSQPHEEHPQRASCQFWIGRVSDGIE